MRMNNLDGVLSVGHLSVGHLPIAYILGDESSAIRRLPTDSSGVLLFPSTNPHLTSSQTIVNS